MKNYKRLFSVLIVLVMILVQVTTDSYAARLESKQASEVKADFFKGRDNFKRVENLKSKKIKSKLDVKLLKLVGKQEMSSGQTKEKLIKEMKAEGQLIQKETKLKNSKDELSEDAVYVYIKTKSSTGHNIIKSLVFKIEDEDLENNLIAAWVEIDKLSQLEEADEVVSIKTVIQPRVNITSQGDKLHRADLVRGSNNGVDGRGIKVGVISDGVDHLAEAIARGELPQGTKVLSNAVGGDEGTAMLEIVHDLAPGAELYFHDCGSNKIAFNAAVTKLAAAGCKIIVDDISWVTEPYFEDGLVAKHIKQVVESYGIVYASSSGNYAKSHYQDRYYDSGNTLHDFSRGTSSNKFLYARVRPGDTVMAVLQWDDPMGASYNDYDLLLFDANTFQLLDYSNESQFGYQDPLEAVLYTNYGSYTIDIGIAVENYDGAADTKTLEVYLFGDCYSNNITPADSIFGQPAIPEVIAVGAINVSNPNQIADYSSQGPVTLRTGTPRQKPDICGAAGVSVTGVGGFPSPFYGTSAAAPHIAAIAALLWSTYPTKNGEEIRDLIVKNSVDLGASGFDSIFGYGLADAYSSLMAARPNKDVNGDGIVDILDLALVAQRYNVRYSQPLWNALFDLNSDYIIDLYDIVNIATSIS
jgi:subtilisin family serine protease